MRKILPVVLCLCLVIGLIGCAAEDTPYVPTGSALAPADADLNATVPDEDAEPQQLTLAYYEDRSMNPFKSNDFTNRALFSLIYQGLFSINENYETIPLLCKEYRVSSDFKTYTYYINDATFSDGTTVTIGDVQASYEAAMDSTYYGERFVHVAKMALTDDGGIAFYLRLPIEDFNLLLDVPIVKASEVDDDHPVGTGPYIYEKSLSGAQLRRNDGWWTSSPDLVVTAENIPLVAAESATQIRDEFEFSDVGLVCADPCSDSYADFRCDYELRNCDNSIMVYLGVNVAYSQEDIFADTTLRSVLTYAIDREKIAEENYNGFARPATLAMDPEHPYYSDSLAAKYEYDPVRFIDAVNRIKLTKEPLRLLVNSDDSMRMRTARDLVKMFAECGLTVELVEKSTSAFVQDVKYGKYDLYLGQTRLSANMDLSAFFRPWGNLSWGGMSDETLYDYCKEALDNHGNFYNLHKAVADDGRVIPILFCGYAVYATRGLLTQLRPARDNVFSYTLGRTDADALIPIDYNNSNG